MRRNEKRIDGETGSIVGKHRLSFRRLTDQRPGPILGNKDFFWKSNDHLNVRGHRLAGLLIARHIMKRQLVKGVEFQDRQKSVNAALRRCAAGAGVE